MKTKVSPAIVGGFVIGAFALLVIALLTFGDFSFFTKPDRFVVYFDESIHGLDLGSPVKLRGVRVGRVVSLSLRYDEKTNRSAVAVVCVLNKDIVTDSTGVVIDVGDRAKIETLVQRGLRARLDVIGLATGLLFVQLDFFNPQEYPADNRPSDARYPVVPYVQSTIEGYQKSIGEILSKAKDINFGELAKDISSLAVSARKRIDELDLKGLTEQWKKTGAQFETLASSPEFKRTFDNVNTTIGELRTAIAKIDAQVEPTSKDLKETLGDARKAIQSFNETAVSARNFITTHGGLGEELGETLSHLNEAADAVKRLADFLERNPNALITGRKRPQ
jgi:paraquat-inducible protein B